MTDADDITRILEAVSREEEGAEARLFERVYGELKSQAARQLRGLPRTATMNTTAVVHEVYVRLFGQRPAELRSRRQFFFASARAMRDVAIEHIRRANAQKRGGQLKPAELELEELPLLERGQMILEVHEALEVLKEEDELCAQVVLLRFFGGLSYDQIAEMLEIPKSRVRREWAFAQDWLSRRLS